MGCSGRFADGVRERTKLVEEEKWMVGCGSEAVVHKLKSHRGVTEEGKRQDIRWQWERN